MITEWVPARRLNSTIVIEGDRSGWVERVGFLPGEIREQKAGYRLPASEELSEYVQGERRVFSRGKMHAERIGRLAGKFYQAVLLRTMKIPYGETMAYSEVAEALRSRAWRATGSALANNPLAILVPCHRVVAKDGIGGFGGEVWLKRKLLELEGAEIP